MYRSLSHLQQQAEVFFPFAGAESYLNWEDSSTSGQAAQAMHVLDSTFGATASLAFLSELLPKDPYASIDEPDTLTSSEVRCWFSQWANIAFCS